MLDTTVPQRNYFGITITISMLGLLTKSVAVMAALQASLGMATPLNKDVAGVEKRDGGYVNAVYFTNWFVSILACLELY